MLIFTLLDDKVADFDRLAEQTAEEVRVGEPDTLVYVIHSVPDAPLQRIFYEIYRNRAAFEAHENKPYMLRFTAERRPFVLATNVIELRLKYAKVAPLPQGPRQPLPSGPQGPVQLPPQPVQLPPQPVQLPPQPRQLPLPARPGATVPARPAGPVTGPVRQDSGPVRQGAGGGRHAKG